MDKNATYSVIELSKVFNVSKVTIYAKLKDPSLQLYTIDGTTGKRLKQEGFNLLQMLLAESKALQQVNSKAYDNFTGSLTAENTATLQLIDELRRQITYLTAQIEVERERYTEERKRNELFLSMLIQRDQILLESKQAKEERKKRGLFSWIMPSK
jgi:hypothetical protein